MQSPDSINARGETFRMTSNFAELHSDAEPLGTVSDFVNEFIEAIEPRAIFEGFSKQESELLGAYLECFGVPRNSYLMREGEEGNFLAILLTGKAVVIKRHDGGDRLIRELKTGEVVGEMSLIDGQGRFGSCMTTEPSDWAVLDRTSFYALLADHPRLGNKLMITLLKLSTSRLRATLEKQLDSTQQVWLP